ncbi:MAG: hypothetical protein JSS44_09810 [Proteobacteria bacterium]|nr:hypothetical protein [Pseudomonadota bacterium]MBS0461428.1 hypothetical protein [Pseudomonadota bacterium]
MFSAYRVFSLLHPARPRHPFVQALLAVFVVCAFLVLLVVGAFIGLLAMLVALVARAFGWGPRFAVKVGTPPASPSSGQPDSRPPDGDVIDGEFHVVEKSLPHGPQG